MKIKFISDGTQEGTKVIDSKTGEILEQIMRVHYIDDGNGSKMFIEIVDPDIDVELNSKEYGKVHYYKTPMTNNGFIFKRERVEDDKGEHIPNIEYVEIMSDARKIQMKLTKYEDKECLTASAIDFVNNLKEES